MAWETYMYILFLFYAGVRGGSYRRRMDAWIRRDCLVFHITWGMDQTSGVRYTHGLKEENTQPFFFSRDMPSVTSDNISRNHKRNDTRHKLL